MFVIIIGFGDGTEKEIIIRAKDLNDAWLKGKNRANVLGGFLLDVSPLGERI